MLLVLSIGIVCFLAGVKIGQYLSQTDKKKKIEVEPVFNIEDGIHNPTELVMLVEDNAVELFYEVQKKILEKEGWVVDDSGPSDGELHFPVTNEPVSLEELLKE